MKKFSGFDKKQNIKTYPSQLRKSLVRLIEENLILNYEPSSSFLEKKNFLVNELEQYIQKYINTKNELLIESTSQSSIHMYSVPVLNVMIDSLYKELDSLNMLPEPNEVFSSSDFYMNENDVVLKSLNNVPEEYFLEMLNENDIVNYFDNNNQIIISKSDKNWNLNFVPSEEYLYEASGAVKDEIDYKSFAKNNNQFISDFVKSCEMLVGNKISISNIEKM
jgi:hypothetical protein